MVSLVRANKRFINGAQTENFETKIKTLQDGLVETAFPQAMIEGDKAKRPAMIRLR